eukprot:9806607-Lingulodinium_polyedra.AAC.1
MPRGPPCRRARAGLGGEAPGALAGIRRGQPGAALRALRGGGPPRRPRGHRPPPGPRGLQHLRRVLGLPGRLPQESQSGAGDFGGGRGPPPA